MPERPEKTMAMLGKYLSLAFLVPSGALAGYWLGKFAAHWIHAEWPQAVCVVVGVAAGTYKVFEELWRDAKRDEREGRNGGGASD
jgi:uncharacterized membrane protein YfcA